MNSSENENLIHIMSGKIDQGVFSMQNHKPVVTTRQVTALFLYILYIKSSQKRVRNRLRPWTARGLKRSGSKVCFVWMRQRGNQVFPNKLGAQKDKAFLKDLYSCLRG